MTSRILVRGMVVLTLAAGAVGCAMPVSSNPTLTITAADTGADRATLDIRVDNPSDYDLTLEQIDWTLTHGPLPVATGVWTIDEPLPSGGNLMLRRSVSYDSPSLDPSAPIELSGQMTLLDPNSDAETTFDSTAFSATK